MMTVRYVIGVGERVLFSDAETGLVPRVDDVIHYQGTAYTVTTVVQKRDASGSLLGIDAILTFGGMSQPG